MRRCPRRSFSALKRLVGRAERGPVLLVGMGGVGMMGLAIARGLFPHPPIVADIDASKREAALAAGAGAAYDPADPGARKALLGATGGVLAACDFVGSEPSLQFAMSALGRGGKVVVVGLLGGTLTTAIAVIPLKAIGIEGTQAGTLAEASELFVLARAGKFAPAPIHERPMAQAQSALDDLRAGRVVGRVVLTG
jgi:propanol-preferring alcohol dehydrogenase